MAAITTKQSVSNTSDNFGRNLTYFSVQKTRTFYAEERTLWARFEELCMINKSLCLLAETEIGLRSLIIIHCIQRSAIIADYHNGPGGGQFAFEQKQIKQLKNRFYCPGKKRDIQIYCAQCLRCAPRKVPSSTAKAKLMSMGAVYSFERIGINIIKPLTKTKRGNRYLLVVVDYYKLPPEAYASVTQDAHSITRILVTEYFSRYGAPYCIHFDQGATL